MVSFTTALNIFALAMLATCIGAWLVWLFYRDRFVPLKWLQPASQTPIAIWGLVDLFVMMVIYVLFELAAVILLAPPPLPDNVQQEPKTATTSQADESTTAAAEEEEEEEEDSNEVESKQPTGDLSPHEAAKNMAALGVARLCSLVAMLAWLAYRYRASTRELGWVPRRWTTDVLLGLVASVMLLPLVIGLQSLLTLVIDYEHNTMSQMATYQNGAVIAAAFVSAGIAAPIVEEFLYRVFLQGWLERLINGMWQARHSGLADAEFQQAVLLLAGGRTQSQKQWRQQDDDASDDEVQSPSSPDGRRTAKTRRPFFLVATPVVVASSLFALAHLGQGPAPIPLFFFALGVGSLYAATQRALPCIVVHLVLNFWSLAILTIGILSGEAGSP